MLRVLVVAPEVKDLPRLAQTSELTRLGDVNGVDVEVIIGPLVTQDRIQARLRRASFDALLWSGHGSAGRLLLPSGEVEPRWLASECKRASVATVILAVCDSDQRHGTEGFTDLIPEAGINLIAMSVTVSDMGAVNYDVALLHALANGERIWAAHRIGLEAIKSSPDVAAPQLFAAYNTSAALREHVAQIEQRVTNGDNAEALALARRFVAELEELEGRVSTIERHIHPPLSVRSYQAAALLSCFLAVMLLAISDTREVIYHPLWVGAIIDVALLGWALLFLRMAITTRERGK